MPVTILIDADACPVKEEVYRVAARYKADVRVVSNSPFRVPVSERVKRVVVSDSFDAADDWIAENGGGGVVKRIMLVRLLGDSLKQRINMPPTTTARFTIQAIK